MPFGLLAPWMLWVAAIVVPPLVLLYFLRLRRRQESVSSTFLWRRAVQDLQVNAPFQRLRRNLPHRLSLPRRRPHSARSIGLPAPVSFERPSVAGDRPYLPWT